MHPTLCSDCNADTRKMLGELCTQAYPQYCNFVVLRVGLTHFLFQLTSFVEDFVGITSLAIPVLGVTMF